MNNIDIIKKRLKDLKILSENLKNCNDGNAHGYSHDENLNIVEMIMDMTRDVHRRREGDGDGQGRGSRDWYRGSQEMMREREVYAKKLSEQRQVQKNPNPQNIQPVSPTPPTQSPTQSLQTPTQQTPSQNSQLAALLEKVSQLQQNNSNLVVALLKEKDKCKQLEMEIERQRDREKEEKEKVGEVEQYNYLNLKEYKLVDSVEVFGTRIKIAEQDYDKIQYTTSQTKLALKQISITLHPSKKPQKYDLSDLIQVNYHPNPSPQSSPSPRPTHPTNPTSLNSTNTNTNIIILKFRQDNQDQYLYMKFGNYQHMRKWDLAIYVNVCIVRNLKRERMFVGSRMLVDEEGDRKEENNGRLHGNTVPQLLKQSQPQSLTKPNLQLLLQLQKTTKITSQQSQSLKQYLLQSQKLSSMYTKLKQSNILNKIDMKIDDPGKNLAMGMGMGRSFSLRSESLSRKGKNLGESYQNALSAIRGEEVNKIIQEKFVKEELSSNKNKQQVLSKQDQQKQKQKQTQKQRQLLTKTLKIPVYMTKYAEGAFKPHPKKVYLSQDETKLCWQDKDEKNPKQFKFVLIDEIISVNYGKIGPGVQKLLSKEDIGNFNKYLLINLGNQKKRTLEFSTGSEAIMENFSNNLKKFLRLKKIKIEDDSEEKEIKF